MLIQAAPYPKVRLLSLFESGATLGPTDARAGLVLPQRISVMATAPLMAKLPVALAKSRTWRGLTTTIANSSVARAATRGSSKPPDASTSTMGRFQALHVRHQSSDPRIVVRDLPSVIPGTDRYIHLGL